MCYLWAEVEYTLGCGIVSSLLMISDWELYVHYEGYVNIAELLKDKYVEFVRPIVEHFTEVTIGEDSMICYSSVESIYKQFRTPPLDVNAAAITAYDCMSPLSRKDTEDLMAVVLPITATRGKKCIDLLNLNYDTANVFDHHKEDMLSDSIMDGIDGVNAPEGAKDESVPLLMILVISAGGSLSVIAFSVVLRYARARAGARRDQIPHMEALSQHILTNCRRSETLLGKGGEAEVYLCEITVAGNVRQVASKMYFRPDTAKAEIIFYEGLPYHENILKVFGCYIDRQSRRWCLVMEYCRHGNMR